MQAPSGPIATGSSGPGSNPSSSAAGKHHHHPLDLLKPLLFDCDYTYEPDLDDRLTVKWFRNEEPEPFYQWLPQRQEPRHFADWIAPLVDRDFITDPIDPLKRYRSLLIRRLSVNLTGQYTCLVSSLAGQDMKRASLVVYQPPTTFTFEHRIFPAQALLQLQPPPAAAPPLGPPRFANNNHNQHPLGASSATTSMMQQQAQFPPTANSNYHSSWQLTGQASLPSSSSSPSPSLLLQPQQTSQNLFNLQGAGFVREQPTQFKNLMPERAPKGGHQVKGPEIVVIRPANNPLPASKLHPAAAHQQPISNVQLTSASTNGGQISSDSSDDLSARIVYTHDGRPVGTRRPAAAAILNPTPPPSHPTTISASRSMFKRQTSARTLPNSIELPQSSYHTSVGAYPAWMLAKKMIMNSDQQTTTTASINNVVRQHQQLDNDNDNFDDDDDHHYLGNSKASSLTRTRKPSQAKIIQAPMNRQHFTLQLHQFQCQATHIMPRPLMLLTVKRDSESIAQYLHEASSVSIRPFEVGDDYFETTSLAGAATSNKLMMLQQPTTTFANFSRGNSKRHILYDIRVTATIALNVSLPQTTQMHDDDEASLGDAETDNEQSQHTDTESERLITLSGGINTVLNFRPNQRMSFECHLEITGTDFEQLKRINLDEKGESRSLFNNAIEQIINSSYSQ